MLTTHALKRLTLIGCTAMLIAMGAAQTASAQLGCPGQGYQNGYGFGAAFGNPAIGASRFLSSHDRPPHFALFPPVYYNDVIVSRPYGVSPFAAPAGIRPVEIDMVVPEMTPVTIENPYYQQPENLDSPASPTTTASQQVASPSSTVQWVENPFFRGNNVADR